MAQHANYEKNLEKQLQLDDDHLLLPQEIKETISKLEKKLEINNDILTELEKKMNEQDTCIFYWKQSIKDLEETFLTKLPKGQGDLQRQTILKAIRQCKEANVKVYQRLKEECNHSDPIEILELLNEKNNDNYVNF